MPPRPLPHGVGSIRSTPRLGLSLRADGSGHRPARRQARRGNLGRLNACPIGIALSRAALLATTPHQRRISRHLRLEHQLSADEQQHRGKRQPQRALWNVTGSIAPGNNAGQRADQ
jgi:hypothetical protein